MRTWQQYFRETGLRGPFSCVLIEDNQGETEMITVFWNELNYNPETEEEADVLIQARIGVLDEMSKNPRDDRVVRGILKDPSRNKKFCDKIIERNRKLAGWD